MPQFDLVILGSGGAAHGVATRCRKAGWSVAIVESREFGGTCALRGCEPKKTLWTVAGALDRARRLGESGLVGADNLRIDWAALNAFKRSFTDPVPARQLQHYHDAGIATFKAHGSFEGPTTIRAGGTTLDARHIVIATGDKPISSPIEGADHLVTSDDFLELRELPKRILFVGGGYISIELAHITRRAGAEVTVLHDDRHPLAPFDQDLVGRLIDHSRRIGINIVLDAKATRIARSGDKFTVAIAGGKSFEADIAVHGLGRAPNLVGLNLDAGQIETADGKLKLDGHLRSISNPAVFAAGDVTAKGPALTPIATHDAECVAANLLGTTSREPDYNGFASNVFAIPPLAMTGLTEAKAREQGLAFELRSGELGKFQSVRREGQANTGAAYKILIAQKDEKILGAHIYGPQAHETINLFALCIRLGLGEGQLRKLLSAYPSMASDIENMLS